MIPSLGFLLFWLGLMILGVGTPIAVLLASSKTRALFYGSLCSFTGTIIFMGIASVNLGYDPSSGTMWAATTVGYLVLLLMIAIAVAALKESLPHEQRLNKKAPEN